MGGAVKSLKGFGRVATNVTKAGLTGLAAGITAAGAAAVTASVKFSQTAKQLSKLSAQTGATTNELSKMQAIGDRLGIDPDDITGAIEELNIRLGETVRDGIGPAAEAFDQLGLDAKRLADLPLTDRIGEIADALKDVRSQATRGFLADEIFGGDAFKILPALRQGSAGMEDIIQRAERLGLVLSNDQVKAGKKLGRSFDDLKDSFKGVATTVAIELLPTIQKVADRVADFAANGKQQIKSFIDTVGPPFQAFFRFVGTSFNTAADFAARAFTDMENSGKSSLEALADKATETFTIMNLLASEPAKVQQSMIDKAAVSFQKFVNDLPTLLFDDLEDVPKNLANRKPSDTEKILQERLNKTTEELTDIFSKRLKKQMDARQNALDKIRKQQEKAEAAFQRGSVPQFDFDSRMNREQTSSGLSDRDPVGAVQRDTTQAFASIFKAIRQDENVQKILKMNHDEAVKQTKRLSQAYRELQKLNRNPEAGIVVGEV